MTQQRAKDLVRLMNYQNGGCLAVGAVRPDVAEMTESERRMVRGLVESAESGSTSTAGILYDIANGGILVTDCKA